MADMIARRRCALAVGLALAIVTSASVLRLADPALLAAPPAAPDAAAVDSAFARFWDAPDTNAAAKAVRDIIGTSVGFDEAVARLKRGRKYSTTVPRGLRRLKRRTSDGLEHNYAVVVPQNYDASRAYQVRVQLHGGIARPSGEPGREGIDRLPTSVDQISVHPSGWVEAMWWHGNQVENLLGILDELKRTYNVDENRVYLTGISDGGTGVYFMAFRETTPWASFLPLIGHMIVLASPDSEADGEMYPGNAVNKPFFIVNAGRDRLYPARIVEPYIAGLRKIGVEVVYHPQPDTGHDTSWWPAERDNFETFVRAHPRHPLPDRLSWETERTDRYNRAHWLIIDRLGSAEGETDFPYTDFFPHLEPSGRVDLVRTGNTVQASTQGVTEFTLLLSPDEFDFDRPIKIVANGRVAFEGKVERSVATLLKWAAHDNDRTMLFGAELKIDVGRSR